MIGFLTLVSRVLGLARESVAASAFGAGPIWSAFTVAFTIPNLFRKLFGEGALSVAFIPLYAQAVRGEGGEGREEAVRGGDAAAGGGTSTGAMAAAGDSLSSPPCVTASLPYFPPSTASRLSSMDFALASVNLLCIILVVLTVLGEGVLAGCHLFLTRPDHLLAVKLTAIMLPYVLLVCGTAFLGAILQVHHRFAAVAATSIVLNAILIVAIAACMWAFDLSTELGRTRGTYLLSVGVLVAGFVQVLVLVPSLRAVGFRFRPVLHVFTPQVRKMLWMTLPVALSAGVLQIGVMLDKGISLFLARADGVTSFSVLGHSLSLPMAAGAAARLNWAQFMYQFPLGVFAIALATAIFPKLSADAMDEDKTAFRTSLRKGLVSALFIGLPASVGMMAVARVAVALMFQRGHFTAADTAWTARSTVIYSAAIWAFSLQQILNRAYYALHDTRTPLMWGLWNLIINLVVEIPLLWTPLGESAMAVGTLVSFAVQSVAMTHALGRRVGGLNLRAELRPIAVMTGASLAMGCVCVLLPHVPGYPHGAGKVSLASQLAVQMAAGAATYAVLCHIGGIEVLSMVRRRRRT
jgi:putative peptidoglycan lipid II flippase